MPCRHGMTQHELVLSSGTGRWTGNSMHARMSTCLCGLAMRGAYFSNLINTYQPSFHPYKHSRQPSPAAVPHRNQLLFPPYRSPPTLASMALRRCSGGRCPKSSRMASCPKHIASVSSLQSPVSTQSGHPARAPVSLLTFFRDVVLKIFFLCTRRWLTCCTVTLAVGVTACCTVPAGR